MQRFSFILILIVLLQVVLPCPSRSQCHVVENDEPGHCEMLLQKCCAHQDREAVAGHDSGQEDSHGEHCPPGCACFCCTAVMIAPLLNAEIENPVINQELAILVSNIPLMDITDRIWQPPRPFTSC